MKQEFEIPSGSPVAIPYKWEAAPGRPIAEAVPVVEPWMSPLRPPPGNRKLSVSQFDSFEPEPPVIDESQLAGKVLMKLNRLRRKSIAAGACFKSEATRVMQQSGRLFALEDLNRCNGDPGTMSRSCSVTSTFDPPNTPRYSTSVDSSFSEPFSMRTTNSSPSAGATPSSPCSTNARPPSYRHHLEDGDPRHDSHELPDDDNKTLPGPSESAWHQPHIDEAEQTSDVPQNRQMRRSYSNFVSTFVRQSSPSHSFKHLMFVRTFRKSKTAKQLDFGS
ncbi:hypothetical protein KC19_5G147400 [Ceratodon purpureus]|uniref:Uncharacterized protein n=1 Tax=Ceratodon purpureus TaxID=3225 RepID=A0A8T0I1I7_CERPU|nr:hypothetical protein KC19_5G147400 [Ceratodon purpureus]